MVSIVASWCLGMVLVGATQIGASASEKVPLSIHSTLDTMFPGWRISSVSSEVRGFLRQRSLVGMPNIIRGDFDGNGGTDYAILIEHPTSSRRAAPSGTAAEVVAFLEDRGAFKPFVLKEPVPPDLRRYLTLQRKGGEGHDLEANKKFRYPNDSIGVWFFGVAGGTYIFENGSFRYVVESD